MPTASLVCLDTTGYVTDPFIKADRLLAIFLLLIIPKVIAF